MGRESRRPDAGDGRPRWLDSAMSDTQQICETCVETLFVDGAAVAVMGTSDSREMVHSTNSVAQQLDELQFVLGEGPCIDAFTERAPVLVADLGDEESLRRWPGYAPAALEAGAHAAFAFPLQAGPTRFGVLELYRSVPGKLAEDQLASALIIMESAVRIVLSDVTTSLVQLSPKSNEYGRADIHRATGMIAVQLNVSIPEALSRLRAAAFADQQPIQRVARSVLDRTVRFTDGGPS